MRREHRLLSALAPTSVPVPTVRGLCTDAAVNEQPFYVMDHVDGHVLAGVDDAAALDPAARAAAAEDLVAVLARLHAVDVDAVGLGDLARREGYVARQLRRWHEQFRQSQEQEHSAGVFRPVELVHEVHAQLAARVPEQQAVALVHGDYRLDNTLVSSSGQVLAVLDWELCTLGDPLADLGILLAYWAQPDDPDAASPMGTPASVSPGFPTRERLVEAYAERSALGLHDLGYYVAFAHWKLACILEGVYVRYAAGAMGASDGSGEGLAQAVLDRAQRSATALSSSDVL
jgi:aminoglycoside phosphotransferase (APT) family kinase protein